MKELIIVGAGGHGLEMVWLARRCGRAIKGFLDSTPEKIGTSILGTLVLGSIETRDNYLDCEFIIAIGNPRSRKKIVNSFFLSEKYQFATLIDPTALIGENIKIGEGSMVCARTIFTVNINIGQHCIVNVNSTLSHGVYIDNFVTIAPSVSVSGDVSIRALVEIGANAVLREKLTINQGAMIGMGAVLTKDVEMNHVMVGSPAKLLKVIEKI